MTYPLRFGSKNVFRNVAKRQERDEHIDGVALSSSSVASLHRFSLNSPFSFVGVLDLDTKMA